MTMPKKLAATASVALAALAAGAGLAAAAPGPTPDEGLTGACNMTNTRAAFGMFDVAANTPAIGNGFTGMVTAIVVSFPDWSVYLYCPEPQ
jgi:hypothetical protein